MSRSTRCLRAAAVLTACTTPALVLAQGGSQGAPQQAGLTAAVYEFYRPFAPPQTFLPRCGTVSDQPYAVLAVSLTFSCAGGSASASVADGFLRGRTTITGAGVGTLPALTPQGAVQFQRHTFTTFAWDDVLTLPGAATGTIRAFYRLDATLATFQTAERPGFGTTVPVAGASVTVYHSSGGADYEGETLAISPGTTAQTGAFDFAFVGGELDYTQTAFTFARLAGPFVGDQYALDGAASADLAFGLTRFAVFDADGRDITAASGLRSSTFVLGADGTVLGVVPEPGVLALEAAGGLILFACRHVRRRLILRP